MELLGAALLWGGYTLVYWGYAHVTGPRNGTDLTFGDIIKPSGIAKVNAFFRATKPISTTGGSPSVAGATSASSGSVGGATAPVSGSSSGTPPANNPPPTLAPLMQPSQTIDYK